MKHGGAALAVLAVALASADSFAEDKGVRYANPNDFYRATRFDLDISIGGGYFFGGPGRGVAFTRVRSGIMFAGWPLILSLGVTGELNNLSAATYGLQAELLHIETGLWAQVGPSVDGHGQFGGMVSVGWSIFGVEAQFRGYDDVIFDRGTHDGYAFALMGKIRIPIGFVSYIRSRR